MALRFFAETALMWHSDRGAITLIQRPIFYAQSTLTLEESFFFLFRFKFFLRYTYSLRGKGGSAIVWSDKVEPVTTVGCKLLEDIFQILALTCYGSYWVRNTDLYFSSDEQVVKVEVPRSGPQGGLLEASVFELVVKGEGAILMVSECEVGLQLLPGCVFTEEGLGKKNKQI